MLTKSYLYVKKATTVPEFYCKIFVLFNNTLSVLIFFIVIYSNFHWHFLNRLFLQSVRKNRYCPISHVFTCPTKWSHQLAGVYRLNQLFLKTSLTIAGIPLIMSFIQFTVNCFFTSEFLSLKFICNTYFITTNKLI